MRLEISRFGGMVPRVDETALSEEFAAYAKNARFDRGVLAAQGFLLEESSDYPDSALANSSVRSVVKLSSEDTRFAFTEKAAHTAFLSPVTPMDDYGRVYFVSDAYDHKTLRYTTNEQYTEGELNISPVSYRLGIPSPGLRPILVSTEIHDPEDENADSPDIVSVAYAYTLVDRYGHESAPSPLTQSTDLAYNREHTVTIKIDDELPEEVNFSGGSSCYRLYRAVFDGSTSELQYIAEYDIASTEMVDEVPLGQEQESIVSTDWERPPNWVRGLCIVSSSFAAAFAYHYVCYSESRLPHAWPADLQYPLRYEPVDLLPLANGLFIVTDGRPYWAEGSDPRSAIPREVPINAPCISEHSLVGIDSAAYYISPTGIVRFSEGTAEIVSAAYMDREYMASLVDSTCKAFSLEGRYVFSTSDDRWMAFDQETGLVELNLSHPPSLVASMFYSLREDTYYFTLESGEVRKVKYETTPEEVEWHSRHWTTPPVGFSCMRVEAGGYPVQVQVRSKYFGEPWEETSFIEVEGPHLVRLPSRVGNLWQVAIKFDSPTEVYRVVLAQSGGELA